jgi:large subunit ribosomal protein L2
MKDLLTKKKPEKKLLKFLKNKAGRGSSGRITVRHKGGGAKRLYRMVDFKQTKFDVSAKVVSIEYDPYRTAYIMLLLYVDGEKRYSIAPHNIKVGDEVVCSENAELKIGNRLKIKNIPVGTSVYNIELDPGRGSKIVRSAGSSAKVSGTEGKYSIVQMPSGEVRKVLKECFVTIGEVSYPEWRYVNIKKAGNSRRRRIRPTVRGSAMNPVDHPHGGGEGRTSIGMKYPKTPTGKHALGVKTRGKKRSDKFILQRRKKKK